MEQIKDELGSDAVLLHTKKYREGGVLGGVEMIEVTAAVDESQVRTPRPASTYKPPTAPILPSSVLEQYRMNEALRQENAVAVPAASVLPPEYDAYTPESTGVPAYPPTEAGFLTELKPVQKKPLVKTSPKQTRSAPSVSALPKRAEDPDAALTVRVAADISAGGEDTVAKRVHSLESELTQMKIMLASVMEKQQPKAFVSIREALRRQYVREDLCEELAGKVSIADVNLDRSDPRAVEVLAGYLKQVMSFTNGLAPAQNGARIVAFIGTTGVGKTTTLAKVAATFVLEQNLKGALITADTYRISAIEQLKKYAEILGLPVEVVYSAEDLKEALARHQDKDFILVDTAGRSQHNEFQMEELRALLSAHSQMEKHLVVSATTKEQDAAQIIDLFMECSPDRVIFTKTDETNTIGMVVNLLAHKELPLSFLSNGQSVPDDIIPATAERLAEMLLRE